MCNNELITDAQLSISGLIYEDHWLQLEGVRLTSDQRPQFVLLPQHRTDTKIPLYLRWLTQIEKKWGYDSERKF